MKFYSKLIRINGESVLAVELPNGKTISIYSLTNFNLAKYWK